MGYLQNVKNMTEIERYIAESEDIKYRGEDLFWNYIFKISRIHCLPVYDLTYIYDDNRCSYFYNAWHFSPEGARRIADEICEIIDSKNAGLIFDDVVIKNMTEIKESIENTIVDKSNNAELNEFLSCIDVFDGINPEDKIGCIVMNANPFTKGHKYLIEQALLNVDYLYVMVVEENSSSISFEDRFEMVKRGCKEYSNVKVIPSGRFIISSVTFGDYFLKENDNTLEIDASSDLLLFARKIAPFLKIKYRFVGEEPLDLVTRQYNDQMYRLCSKNGIEIIEIPRMKIEGIPVNATEVRRLICKLNDQSAEKLKLLIPETTYDYLINNLY